MSLNRGDNGKEVIAEDEGFLLALGPTLGRSLLKPESLALGPSPMTIQASPELAIELLDREIQPLEVRQDIGQSGEDYIFAIILRQTLGKKPYPGSAGREEPLKGPFLPGPQSFKVGTLEQRSPR